MALVDWILLGILGLSFLLGLWRGLVYEVLSVFVWIAAFFLAQWFAPEVASRLPMAGSAQSLRYAAGFIVVFIGSAFVAGVFVQLIKRLVAAVGLRPVDRTLGAVFGLIRGAILLLALAVVMNMTALRSQSDWQASQGAGYLTNTLMKIKPLLPQDFAKYLP
jgi:membrane protein required for colicin V production